MNAAHLVSATELPPDTLRESLFNNAFADYVAGPFHFGPSEWMLFLLRQGVDLQLSRVALLGTQARGFALVCPRPDVRRWRIGGMGLVPPSRGDGSAHVLMTDVAERARQAGCSGLELEVFVQNERAISLYRREGFVATHVLGGYRLQPNQDRPRFTDTDTYVGSVDAASSFAWLSQTAVLVDDLPFQVLGRSLRALAAPLQTLRRGSAQMVYCLGPNGAATIHSLIDRDSTQQDARVLVGAMLCRHTPALVSVPPLQRLDVGGQALLDLGFEVQVLKQQQMRKQIQ